MPLVFPYKGQLIIFLYILVLTKLVVHSSSGPGKKMNFVYVFTVVVIASLLSATKVSTLSFSFFIFVIHPESNEFDQEIPQSQTAYQPTAPRGRATEH